MCAEAYVALELQCPLLVFDFNQNLNVTTVYLELASITFHEYLSTVLQLFHAEDREAWRI